MFGHFKAEEFLNVIEGASLATDRRAHLDSCPACKARLRSVESVHTDISMLAGVHEDIPEPDWNEFRLSVRNCCRDRFNGNPPFDDGPVGRFVQPWHGASRWCSWFVS